jgi:hypothetical protein
MLMENYSRYIVILTFKTSICLHSLCYGPVKGICHSLEWTSKNKIRTSSHDGTFPLTTLDNHPEATYRIYILWRFVL